MSTRYGAVIVFKDGISKERAEQIVRELAMGAGALIDDPRSPARPEWKLPAHSGVHEFDDSVGGPVWYIP